MKKIDRKIAYFSMEIAIKNDIKSFSGGLGVLAGDTLKSAADLSLPMLGITLLNKKGYFKQVLNEHGEQMEKDDNYDTSQLREVGFTNVKIASDTVKIRVWEYVIVGRSGGQIPVFFLDTDLEENDEKYRSLTDHLYGGDQRYRLLQEIILGRGGVRFLSDMGYENIEKYHLNEGHAALATIELISRIRPKPLSFDFENAGEEVQKIRRQCVFTTHTPVEAGHDIFPMEMVKELQPDFPTNLPSSIIENGLNMSRLATYFSSYINGVSRKHQEVSAEMFPNYNIAAITNGAHSQTWTSPEFQKLFDEHIPGWRKCSLSLRNAFNIPKNKIEEAHQKTKMELIDYVKEKTGTELSPDIFTLGFARRFATYKRPNLIFQNIDRLLQINEEVGALQIIYAGKAHPNDNAGKDMIKEVIRIKEELKDKIKIVFLENYDMNVAKKMISGVDLWLNNPLPPNEGSGTSGMKAAHNGVPHLSTLDGWWLEGYIAGKTGWAIGLETDYESDDSFVRDAEDLYQRLEKDIIPLYYDQKEEWIEVMQYTIAINASFFNSERMLRQYAQEAYLQ